MLRGSLLIALCVFHASAANWISTKIGPFVVYSQASPKDTRGAAAELEQLRFSLGELLSRREITVHPQLELLLLGSLPPIANPIQTRTGAIALAQGTGPLTPANRESLARILLEQNVGRMPPSLERGLETFLSTTLVQGAKVTWGTPPPIAQQTPEWRLVHGLITNPDTYGNVRVLLANLENGVAEDVAYRSAFHQSKESLAAQATHDTATIDAPSRPLSPERDLPLRTLSENEVNLRLADLLNDQSEARYRALLNSGEYKAEALEGLALLAAQRKDASAAADYLHQALTAGSKNGSAFVAYARIEPDPAKAQAALEHAVQADPSSAEAHFLLGKLLKDPARKLEQWRSATRLDPRNQAHWVALAGLLADQQQWTEASKAWRSAEQAAGTPEEREKIVAARIAIETQRLEAEEAEKRRQREAEERETNRLKQQALAEIRAAEAKVNTANASDPSNANAIPWDQLDSAGSKIEGQLIRVDCIGSRKTLVIRQGGGTLLKLLAPSSTQVLVHTPGDTLTCGPQRDRKIAVTFEPSKGARSAVAGRALSIEFR